MADQVKLFGVWESPFSKRVEIALKMKGVEYEYVEEDLSAKSPEILKYNPVHNKVPVFLHNGKPLAESLVIVEYIDETWTSGTPILPTDPHERATARFWAKFIEDKILAAMMKLVRSKGEEQEKAIEEVSELLKPLEGELKGKFFGGETIGLVDIAGIIVGFWLGVLTEALDIELLITKDKFPKLCQWADDYVNCSVIKETMPPRDKLLAFFQSRFGK